MRKSSTYAQKGKPMPYSEIYQQWRSAIIAGRVEDAANLDQKHKERFGNARS